MFVTANSSLASPILRQQALSSHFFSQITINIDLQREISKGLFLEGTAVLSQFSVTHARNAPVEILRRYRTKISSGSTYRNDVLVISAGKAVKRVKFSPTFSSLIIHVHRSWFYDFAKRVLYSQLSLECIPSAFYLHLRGYSLFLAIFRLILFVYNFCR